MVDFIPDYISSHVLIPKKEYGYYEKSYRVGVAMDLKKNSTSNDYLSEVLSTNSFKYLRRSINRLNRDGEIQLVPYYGSIDTETYHSLFKQLQHFIKSRFNQKKERHAALGRWKFYEDTLYDLILQKKASLFVLYDGEKPISISLNYHYDERVLDLAINSYDISYQKYSLGRQMIVRQLEWAYDNNYELIDLRWGAFSYKVDFSNTKSKYRTHVFYTRKNIPLQIMAWCTSLGFYCKYYLYNDFLATRAIPKIKALLRYKPDC